MVSELLCQKAGAPRIEFPKPGVALQDELLRQRHQSARECQGFTGSKQLPTLVLQVRNERDIGFPAMPFFLCSASLLNLNKGLQFLSLYSLGFFACYATLWG